MRTYHGALTYKRRNSNEKRFIFNAVISNDNYINFCDSDNGRKRMRILFCLYPVQLTMCVLPTAKITTQKMN